MNAWTWSLIVLLSLDFHLHRTIQYVFSCVWLLSISLMPMRFTHVNLCGVWSVASDSLQPHGSHPQGYSIHRISQARILDWVAISFSRGYSWLKDWASLASPALAGRLFTTEPHGKPMWTYNISRKAKTISWKREKITIKGNLDNDVPIQSNDRFQKTVWE